MIGTASIPQQQQPQQQQQQQQTSSSTCNFDAAPISSPNIIDLTQLDPFQIDSVRLSYRSSPIVAGKDSQIGVSNSLPTVSTQFTANDNVTPSIHPPLNSGSTIKVAPNIETSAASTNSTNASCKSDSNSSTTPKKCIPSSNALLGKCRTRCSMSSDTYRSLLAALFEWAAGCG